MSFDPTPPQQAGIDGLIDWCRRDRSGPRLLLAAAAGDPVAIAQLRSDLARPTSATSPAPLVEIVAARRPDQLLALAGMWPDANDPDLDPAGATAWRAALRHLEAADRIHADAALRGPIAGEAELVILDAQPDLAPVRWASFCDRASSRTFPLDELRTIDRLGFVEATLDVAALAGRPATLLRALRSHWDRTRHLGDYVERYDVWNAEPLDLAVWSEAAAALGRRDRLADRLGEAVVQQLVHDDQPQRWWPAVLAALTGWVVP